MMRYFSCVWSHSNKKYPVFLASEVGPDDYETRKIELWFDGRVGWSDGKSSSRDTELGDQPIPPLSEINESDEFFACEISEESFERIWAMRNQPEAEQGVQPDAFGAG